MMPWAQVPMAQADGGRNEETYSKYAEGIREKRYPSRRQYKNPDVSIKILQAIDNK